MSWFKYYLFGCNLLVPALFLVCGLLMHKRCPKKINGVIGYRTRRSMKNEETWRFAHNCIGRLWEKLGAVTIPLTVIVQAFFLNSSENTLVLLSGLLLSIQGVFVCVSIVMTEKALKKEFPE